MLVNVCLLNDSFPPLIDGVANTVLNYAEVLSKMEDTWREFRALHPYSYQTVALKHYGDTCVFVMSEPDSWVKKSDLEQLFDKFDGQLILRYQPYGFDGQLTDAVGCAILDSISFHEFEKELFTLLYKTILSKETGFTLSSLNPQLKEKIEFIDIKIKKALNMAEY